VELTSTWVTLPNLPFEYWSFYLFKAIGNTLGHFLDADMYLHESNNMMIGRILVELDLCEVLVEKMILNIGSIITEQILYYAGPPFKCLCCHNYKHLAIDYGLLLKKKVWMETNLHKLLEKEREVLIMELLILGRKMR
jgi:hypothetical protein